MPLPTARQLCVDVAFVAAIGAVVWLDRHDPGRGATLHPADVTHGMRFTEVAAQSGISFRHAAFDVDPQIANIAAHVAGLGAGVALVDYDRDGRLDIFTTSSKAGTEN